jgi:hypothetical protein
MNHAEMPKWFTDLMQHAYRTKDTKAIITLNREWRLFLKERLNITLKG